MSGTSEHGTGWNDLDAAGLLLDKLGVRPADLMAAPVRTEFPLIAGYIPLVEKAVTTEPGASMARTGQGWSGNGGTGGSTSPPRWRSASSPSKSGKAPCSAGTPAEDAAPPST